MAEGCFGGCEGGQTVLAGLGQGILHSRQLIKFTFKSEGFDWLKASQNQPQEKQNTEGTHAGS